VLRIALGVLVVAHGLITGAIWTAPPTPDAPFVAGHSWLLGDSRFLAVPVSILLALGFALAGVGLVLDQAWWAAFGLAAGVGALVFMLMYFNPWLLAGLAISGGIAFAAGHTLLAAE
jgi:hypothetical protein